jgi:diguanylate cyclase (GGDEF)-like protein
VELREVNSLASGATQATPPPSPARSDGLVDSYRRLADVFHEVLSEQTHSTVLERIADSLADVIPYDAFTIYQADEARRLLIPVMARDRWRDEIMSARPVLGEGITGWAIDHCEPQLVNEAHLDPRVKTVPGTPDEPEALISVPLVARGAVKGALNVYRLGAGAQFSEEEFELAKRFGDAAALALDNAQVRAALELQAQTDSLTGLYNHRYFHDRLRSELNRASRTHDSIAVLMLDLDDFKRVNDTLGHPAGDRVLREFAMLVSGGARGTDLATRYGGEEFAIVLPHTDRDDAHRVAERIRAAVADFSFLEPDHPLRVTVSAGAATFAPGLGITSSEQLVAAADRALYAAKKAGKNRVVVDQP